MSNIKNNFNELFHDPQEVIVPMFADNTSHVCLARTENGLLELSRQALDRVSTWMCVNKLQALPVKSSFIIYSRTATYYPSICRLKHGYGEIKRKSCVKYLGITLDELCRLENMLRTCQRYYHVTSEYLENSHILSRIAF